MYNKINKKEKFVLLLDTEQLLTERNWVLPCTQEWTVLYSGAHGHGIFNVKFSRSVPVAWAIEVRLVPGR